MRRGLIAAVSCAALLFGTCPSPLRAQTPQAGQQEEAQTFSVEQLDALLAPIALYPDELLSQTLMATTYPLQVIEAARWLDEPGNKALSGDALTRALTRKNWDPSVKSLVPFPQVLAMMNGQIQWLQQVGFAMAAQQAAVMDSVQRLRRQAQAAGQLQTTPQQVVRIEGQTVIIRPAQPTVVYVPIYNPALVYGPWPYPAYPPVYLPPPPGYAIGTAIVAGLAFGAAVSVTAGLWGWANPNWRGGNVSVNVNRYNAINVNRPPLNNPNWRPGVPTPRAGAAVARPPLGPVGAPARSSGLPPNGVGRPSVAVPGSVVRPPSGAAAANRPVTGQGTAARPGGGNLGATGAARPGGDQNPARTNQTSAPRALSQAARPGEQRQGVSRTPGAFNGMNDGRNAGQFTNRGAQSRQSNVGQAPRGGGGARLNGSAGGRGR